jgi:hypothetical protein
MRKIDVLAAIVNASLDGIYVSAYAEDGKLLLKGMQESVKDYSNCPEIESLVQVDGYFNIDKFMEQLGLKEAKLPAISVPRLA